MPGPKYGKPPKPKKKKSKATKLKTVVAKGVHELTPAQRKRKLQQVKAELATNRAKLSVNEMDMRILKILNEDKRSPLSKTQFEKTLAKIIKMKKKKEK